MQDVVLVSPVRTAIGRFGGALAEVSAIDLGAVVVRESIRRAGLSPSDVDEVVMGNVVSAGLGANPGRHVLLKAGLPIQTPGFTINKACASSLKAVQLAALSVASGDAKVVVAGGTENMSAAPYLLRQPAFLTSPGVDMDGLAFGYGLGRRLGVLCACTF